MDKEILRGALMTLFIASGVMIVTAELMTLWLGHIWIRHFGKPFWYYLIIQFRMAYYAIFRDLRKIAAEDSSLGHKLKEIFKWRKILYWSGGIGFALAILLIMTMK